MVYFVLRCPYLPNQKVIQEFDAIDVLTWFQSNWKDFEQISHSLDRLQIVSNFTDRYGTAATILADFVAAIAQENLTLPITKLELFELLDEYVEASDTVFDEDFFSALTSFQGVEMAWYIFDDAYAAQNLDRVAFLLYQDFYLPEIFSDQGLTPNAPFSILPKKGGGQGKIFMVFNTCYVEDNLETLEEALVIEGIRVPDLIDYLGEMNLIESLPMELVIMSQLVKDYQVTDLEDLCEVLACLPFDEIAKNYVFSSEGYYNLPIPWTSKSQDSSNSDWQVSDHCLQISNHFIDTLGGTFPDGTALYNHWIIFDDLWAQSNPELATSILYFAASWDCLD